MDAAVEAAVEQFREYGYEGTSAQMLVDAMEIGRQSLYDSFRDKWGVYLAAVRRYAFDEVRAHGRALASSERGLDAIRALLDRVVDDASRGCLGTGSIVEFGCTRQDLVALRDDAGARLAGLLKGALARARDQGDLAEELDPDTLVTFLVSTISGIRLAARAGTPKARLSALADLAMRALR